MDAEDRLRPDLRRTCARCGDAGDAETARALVEPLHPADVADLIELARADEREGLVAALAGLVDAEVLAELNEHVREILVSEMAPERVAEMAGELGHRRRRRDHRDLEEDEQRAVLRAMEPDDRAAIEEALTYGEETAGRLMQRDLIAVPSHWNVGQVIDYLRSERNWRTTSGSVRGVAGTTIRSGTCKLSTILRSPAATSVASIMIEEAER
jgi:magnesium transporter